jgi:MFS family permease
MAAVAVTGTGFPRTSWCRVAFAMLAVGWGANQFSPLLIVYRHDLGLDAGVLAGLFGIYAATLIPGLLIGGPVSDRIGRRPVVIPFVVASPLATLLFMLGPHSLAVIAAGRALAGLCSGVVFGSATAWVQELSDDPGASARRSAVAMSAGFGLGPSVAAVLAQWAGDPLVLPYLPHVVIGAAAVAVVWRAPGTGGGRSGRRSGIRRRWPPRAVRSRRFWLAVAPAAPWAFGTATLAFVVLPQEVTSAGSPSAGFAGLVTAVTVGSAVAAQPLARRLEARRRLAGNVAGLACAAAGAILTIVAVATLNRAVAIACAVVFGLAYGFCLVSGLRESERLADRGEHGAVVACYYALTYVGFGAAYLVDGLNAVIGRTNAFAALAAAAAVSAVWMGAYTAGSRPPDRRPGAGEAATDHMRSAGAARST